MSDDFHNSLGQFFDQSDFGHVAPLAPAINPDWNGNLYAPINYTAPSSSYTKVSPTLGSGDHAAQDLNAKIIRQQYRDYETRFQPIEDLAVSLLTKNGTKDLPYDIARTNEVVGGVFHSLQGQQDRAIARYGQANTADKIEGSSAEASARVGGLNGAVLADEARRMELLGGGTTTGSGAVASAMNGS